MRKAMGEITKSAFIFSILFFASFALKAQMPTAVCQDITVQLDAAGVVTITAMDIDGGSTDDVGIVSSTVVPDTFSCGDIGVQMVTLTVEDGDGNMDSCTAMVTIEDTTPPTAVCQDITVELDASGNATITAAMIDNGSSDNCVAVSLGASQTTFDCSDLGANNVTLTVTDVAGLSATCTAVVTVQDMIPPTAVCQDITLPLDPSGTATLDPALIDGGSTDNCQATLSFSASQTSFTCADAGPQNITLTVTDAAGNMDTCVAVVTIGDSTPPSILCQDITVTLDATGNVTIDPTLFDNGSTDNCGNVAFSASQVDFSCDDVLNVLTDELLISGIVYGSLVDDTQMPPVTTFYRAIEIFAMQDIPDLSIYGLGVANDAMGSDGQEFTFPAVSLTAGTHHTVASDVMNFNQFFGVNPDFVDASLDIDGNDAVELYQNGSVIDTFGELTYAPPTVMNPLAWDYELGWAYRIGDTRPDGTSFLIDNWFFSTPGALDGEDTNATALAPFPIGVYNFVQEGVLNPIQVTVTATDDAGNMSTCMATVTVEDNTAPIAIAQDLVVQLDANGEYFLDVDLFDNGSSDACGFASRVTEPSAFFCDEVGDNTVTLTVTDVYGNTSSTTATITVQDITPPVMICENITVQLDAAGNATITADQIGSASEDICGFDEMDPNARTIDVDTFDCTNVGLMNMVTYTAIDKNGNSNTCTAIVTVEDNVPPNVICQNITVQLDATGNATLTAIEVDGGSTDACGIASRSISQTTFTCDDLGTNTVTLSVTDINGNTDSCTATVTVEDLVPPVANAMDITLGIGTSGSVTVLGSQLNDGSTDNCGIDSFSVTPDTFTCTDIGAPVPVTLSVTDASGNTSTASANVTLVDNVPPDAICQNITVQLDAAGIANITVDDVDNGSSTACGGITRTIDISSFDCSNIGANNVVFTVTNSNNVSTQCTAIVTVEDAMVPTVVCQDLSVVLDNSGNASITANDIDNGSSDNCGIASVAINTTSFTCADVGANIVTLTVTDVNGNVNSCDATVTVSDTIAPVAICQNSTIQLDIDGNATITADQVDGGSTDFCGIVSRVIDIDTFTCDDLGPNTVELTVTDASGNSAVCAATITVTDVIPPVVNCQNITVQLDVSGNASIAASDIDNGSTDGCGIASIDIDTTLFTCANIGSNNVTLTVTDTSGNASSCVATVTVEDSEAPDVVCQNLTVQLDDSGTAFINETDIDGGSSDPCGISSIAIDRTSFTCDDLGDNDVVLTVTDINGNVDSCTAIVTVQDVDAPEITCPGTLSQSIEEDTQYTTPDFAATGLITVIDNCSDPVTVVEQIPAVGELLDVGLYDATLTVQDSSGNEESCFFTLNITDSELSLEDLSLSTISILPNPADAVMFIDNPQGIELSVVRIYDITGRVVQEMERPAMDARVAIDISNLEAATYLVSIEKGSQRIIKQLIKE